MKKIIIVVLVLLMSMNLFGCHKEEHDCKLQGHVYGLWIVDKMANCEEDGVRHCECKYCGYYLENTIEAYHHSSSSWTIVKEPNCQEEGLTQLVCNYCLQVLQEKKMDKLEHEYDENGFCIMCQDQREIIPEVKYQDFVIQGSSIISYIGQENYVLVPAFDEVGNPITEIGENAFKNCTTITTVEMQEGITTLGYCAFEGCTNLKEIILSNTLETIHAGCFNGCESMKHLYIPASVTLIEIDTEIYGCALGDLGALETITVDEDNKVYNSNGNCNALIETDSKTLIRGCINTTIPEGVVTIGAQSFGCTTDLISIVLPTSVEFIDYLAFVDCENLMAITIGSTMKDVDDYAFEGCFGLKNLALNADLNSYNFLMYLTKGCKITYSGTKAQFEEKVLSKVDLVNSNLIVTCDDEVLDFSSNEEGIEE